MLHLILVPYMFVGIVDLFTFINNIFPVCSHVQESSSSLVKKIVIVYDSHLLFCLDSLILKCQVS